MNSIQRFIERRLRLLVNEEKSSVTGPNALTFLGFRLGKNAQGEVKVTLSDRTSGRLNTRIRELTPRVWGQSLSRCLAGLNRYLQGWIGYFRLCSQEVLKPLGRFDAHIRRRLRALIIRQRKRDRHFYRHLLSRGVSPRLATKSAFKPVGIWRRSVSNGIHRAYPNAWFAERLGTLVSHWHSLNPSRRVSLKQRCLFEY